MSKRFEERIKRFRELMDQGISPDDAKYLMQVEDDLRKQRNKLDWWEVIPVAYAVMLIGSFFVGLSTHSQIAWGIFWYAFLFGIVVWLGQVFFGALGILGGIARWAGKQ